ncbi:MAG: hypothetical protein ICV84_16485 [Flavisolibacter sp.]|nr:hypothetical protein [Flavisolibacter sp.]
MSVTKKNKKATTLKGFAEVDNKVGNYEKHPFFVKKANEAKKFLKRAGLPKDFKAK